MSKRGSEFGGCLGFLIVVAGAIFWGALKPAEKSHLLELIVAVTICAVVIGITCLWIYSKFEAHSLAQRICKHGKRGAVSNPSLCQQCVDETAAHEEQRKKVARDFERTRYREWAKKVQIGTYLKEMDPREFEGLVCHLFEKMGYQAEMTPVTGDNGVDAYLTKDNKKYILQCKRVKGSVGEPVLRDLFGTMHATGACGAYVVTTGVVSKQARTWATGKPISLIEFIDLQRLLKQYFPIDAILPPDLSPIIGNKNCPTCGNTLRLVNGRRGPFLGCSSYPKCRYTRSVVVAAPWE